MCRVLATQGILYFIGWYKNKKVKVIEEMSYILLNGPGQSQGMGMDYENNLSWMNILIFTDEFGMSTVKPLYIRDNVNNKINT